MEDLMGDLDSMSMDLRNWQDQLKEVSWPSRSISLMANDVIVFLGMSARVIENLVALLEPLQEAMPEVEEVKEEEEGGEGVGEQVPGEEVHEEPPPETG